MSAREMMLKRIAEVKPPFIPLLVETSLLEDIYPNLIEKFSDVLRGIGGEVDVVENMSFVDKYLSDIAGNGHRVINCTKRLELPPELISDANTRYFESVYVACMRGAFAVAENASVWVDEIDMLNRLLPFICQHLVLVIESEYFVATMHEAYEKIDTLKSGYGTFIAGPSKTADIEQSLVIGAHGPRSLKIFILRQ